VSTPTHRLAVGSYRRFLDHEMAGIRQRKFQRFVKNTSVGLGLAIILICCVDLGRQLNGLPRLTTYNQSLAMVGLALVLALLNPFLVFKDTRRMHEACPKTIHSPR